MKIFGVGKKVTVMPAASGNPVPVANGESNAANTPETTVSGVKVLGGGCAKCNQLEEATVAALAELGMDTAIEHVRDYAQIAAYGVMSTPALVVDERVVSTGKVLKKEEVIALIRSVRQ